MTLIEKKNKWFSGGIMNTKSYKNIVVHIEVMKAQGTIPPDEYHILI